MAIIVISHHMGAGGPEIGMALSQRLGYRYVNQELLLDAARRYGLAEGKLSHLEESKPTLFERFDTETRHHITVLQTTQFEFAEMDNAVLMRGGGQWLLRGVPHALRVRRVAPFDHRGGAADRRLPRARLARAGGARHEPRDAPLPDQRGSPGGRGDARRDHRARARGRGRAEGPGRARGPDAAGRDPADPALRRLARFSGREGGVGGAVGRLRDAELERAALATPYDRELDGFPHLRVRRQALEVMVVLDLRAVERDDHVVLDEARRRGGASRVDAGDHCAARVPHPQRLRELRRQRLHRDAYPTPDDLAAVDELARHALDHVGRNREADTLARRDDRGVDPDDLAAQVHERPARVAAIDRRVRLDEVLVRRDTDVGPSRRAH